MGTRGIAGFRVNGELKIYYNQYDTYPDGLGSDIVEFMQEVVNNNQLKQLKKNVEKVQLVSENDEAPSELQDRYHKYLDKYVSTQTSSDWYCLLRQLQGIGFFQEVLEGNVEHMLDAGEFYRDSLFCEYGYIVDLDKNRIEMYQGFNKEPQKNNPLCDHILTKAEVEHAKKMDWEPYYPIKLIAIFDLNNIPDNWMLSYGGYDDDKDEDIPGENLAENLIFEESGEIKYKENVEV